MSIVLLVELWNRAMLYRVVRTEPKVEFRSWNNGSETQLFWKGRRVRRLFSLGDSPDCWRSVPLGGSAGAIARLREEGCCLEVWSRPSPEGRLPV